MTSVCTGWPQIDSLFGGSGLQSGRITELVGLPGSGKSAITYNASSMRDSAERSDSLQVIKQILLTEPEGKVLVFDTKASFPIVRLQRMLSEEAWMDQDQCTLYLEYDIHYRVQYHNV